MKPEETLPTSVMEEETHLALKSHKSPLPQSRNRKGRSPPATGGDQEGHWKHPAPEPGCGKHFRSRWCV
eukprot:1150852-Pelagomonas_calceolata.AAC.11